MSKYKTFEELKEELGDKFEDYMYKANIELLNKLDKIKEWKKQTLFDLNRQYKTFEYWEELFEDLDKLLEEIK